MHWRGWGDPARATPLPEPVVELLRQALGVQPATPPVEISEVRLPERSLPVPAYRALLEVVGADNVQADPEARIRHTRGKSTADLLRIRAGDAVDAPDAVVFPGSHADVVGVLEVCSQHRVAVVPFGGGTSVVGGLAPHARSYAGVVAMDLRRLDRLLELDAESRVATVESGVLAPRAEALLRERGFTLGHFPQSYEWASIGGFAATRSSGQASAGYGRFDDMVMRLRVATPAGTLELGRAPKSAAGPDLRQLVLGSEGAFGVITSVSVRVRPVPEMAGSEGWRFPTFDAGVAATRRLAQDGPVPAVLRLSDKAETAIGLADPEQIGSGEPQSGCLLVVGYEGSAASVAGQRDGVATVLLEAGGEPLGDEPGERWAAGRYAAPYLRDALLDVGAFVETLETATFWSNLPRLYAAVRDALNGSLTEQGAPPLVLCHMSHVYPTGASLYFTVVCAQGDDPVVQWRQTKSATGDAIIAAGGTISHHHGVGTDHRDWLAAELGPLGIEILRAVKERLDPAGILNPGVLVP